MLLLLLKFLSYIGIVIANQLERINALSVMLMLNALSVMLMLNMLSVMLMLNALSAMLALVQLDCKWICTKS